MTVVLDEVGLAEVSAHNPLKVLHTLLEPEEAEVAVVGISNWALDAGGWGVGEEGEGRHVGENPLELGIGNGICVLLNCFWEQCLCW